MDASRSVRTNLASSIRPETTFILESTRADRKLRSLSASWCGDLRRRTQCPRRVALAGRAWRSWPFDNPADVFQEIGTDVLPIDLEKIDARIHGRMRQAPLRLLEPLGNVDPLAKALGLDPCEILSQPTPRPAYTGAAQCGPSLIASVMERSSSSESFRATNPGPPYRARFWRDAPNFLQADEARSACAPF